MFCETCDERRLPISNFLAPLIEGARVRGASIIFAKSSTHKNASKRNLERGRFATSATASKARVD